MTAGAGNNDYGWHTGGIYGLPNPRLVYSTVARIDYSNDTATASVRGPLAATRGYHQGAGNANYGYFAAGSPSGVLVLFPLMYNVLIMVTIPQQHHQKVH